MTTYEKANSRSDCETARKIMNKLCTYRLAVVQRFHLAVTVSIFKFLKKEPVPRRLRPLSFPKLRISNLFVPPNSLDIHFNIIRGCFSLAPLEWTKASGNLA